MYAPLLHVTVTWSIDSYVVIDETSAQNFNKNVLLQGKKRSQKIHDVTLHLNVFSLERKLIHVSSISNRFSTSAKMHFFPRYAVG